MDTDRPVEIYYVSLKVPIRGSRPGVDGRSTVIKIDSEIKGILDYYDGSENKDTKHDCKLEVLVEYIIHNKR